MVKFIAQKLCFLFVKMGFGLHHAITNWLWNLKINKVKKILLLFYCCFNFLLFHHFNLFISQQMIIAHRLYIIFLFMFFFFSKRGGNVKSMDSWHIRKITTIESKPVSNKQCYNPKKKKFIIFFTAIEFAIFY